MALKGARELICLISKGVQADGKNRTGFFKMSTKNKRDKGKTQKIKRMCFDPRAWDGDKNKLGKRVEFEEGKL